MRQRKLAQSDLFKTPHELTPSQRTTAVALLKALLTEAMSPRTSTAVEEPPTTTENKGVEIGEGAGK
jgi:hypothetical protein